MASRRQSDEPISRFSNPESMENDLIAKATALAAKRLEDGTASNQVIVHYLKLGSKTDRMRQKHLEKEVELMDAKIEAYKSSSNLDAAYAQAVQAMGIYSGSIPIDSDGDVLE